jgi:competence protein ComEC
MRQFRNIPVWVTSPFLRLLVPLVAGIVAGWYLQVPLLYSGLALCSYSVAYWLCRYLPFGLLLSFYWLKPLLLQLMCLAVGMLLVHTRYKANSALHYSHYYQPGQYVQVCIGEPLVEKNKSYKAEAYLNTLFTASHSLPVNGKILLYFAKSQAAIPLQYGDVILLQQPLQAIKNSGNPGGFNYQRYAAFQGIHHQVYLKPGQWVKLNSNKANAIRQLLFTARQNILQLLRRYITTNKDGLGIAEALFIGYTADLDKDLVQAYSNTGVVHIIAISGMHLGLIYGLLVGLFGRIPYINKYPKANAILIITALWLFALLTGASASVVRSAVMFTCIAAGQYFFRESKMYNSLAASAFMMLLYNPFYLWDVGFQLSYLAVLGIVIFQQPIYHLFYVPWRLPDLAWRAAALTTSAQVLTFPVCIYYFHQFPVLFIFTNLVAVPLSTIILYAAIFLTCFGWLPPVASVAGFVIGVLVDVMNGFINWVNGLSFAVWDGLPANIATTWLLYGFVILLAAWLMHARPLLLRLALLLLVAFTGLHAWLGWQVHRQQKMLVYHVPKYKAIDFIQGQQYVFAGDTALLQDGLLQNFHLKPARIAQRLTHRSQHLPLLFQQPPFYQMGSTLLYCVDGKATVPLTAMPQKIDYIIVSNNPPRLQLAEWANRYPNSQIVFDGSNALWKIAQWKQQCLALHLRHFSTADDGAFEINIQ